MKKDRKSYMRKKARGGSDIPEGLEKKLEREAGIEDDIYDPDYDADPDYPEAEAPVKKMKRKKSKAYVFISYAFVLLFLVLIGYLAYFMVYDRSIYMTSAYNTRQDALAKYIERGNITTSDGVVVAETVKDGEGNESRNYPYSNEYAHIIGYSVKGKSGVESIANYELLTSHQNYLTQLQNELFGKKNKGDTVVTTLNSKLQDAAYNALGDYKGAIVVMNPKTGAILAMVSKPDFNPNTISADWDTYVNDESSSVLLNRATQGRYAPGSTFKIITALAYYKTHGSLEGFEFNCTGTLTYKDYTVRCSNQDAHGQEDFTKAFANSCNCAFSQIGLDLGAEIIANTANSLLFNAKLPSAELYSNPASFTLKNDSGDFALMQTAFGQGDTLTSPYHMALVVSAIANKGILMEPYIIEKTVSADGEVVSSTTPKEYKSLMSEDEANMLTELMRTVVESGTASKLSGQSYTAAGKTGSAQYTKSDGTLGTHAWFVGFSSIGDSDLAIAVIAEDGDSGSDTAVPMAKMVFDAYYGG